MNASRQHIDRHYESFACSFRVQSNSIIAWLTPIFCCFVLSSQPNHLRPHTDLYVLPVELIRSDVSLMRACIVSSSLKKKKSFGADTVDGQLCIHGGTVCRSNSFSINLLLLLLSPSSIARTLVVNGTWRCVQISNNINKIKLLFATHGDWRPEPLDHTRMKRVNSCRLIILLCTSHKAMVREHEFADCVDCGLV